MHVHEPPAKLVSLPGLRPWHRRLPFTRLTGEETMRSTFSVHDVVTHRQGISQIGEGNTINVVDPDERRRSIQKWFAPWLFDDDDRSSVMRSQSRILRDKGTPTAGSGSWLLDRSIPEWLASVEHDCLWIHGDVGSGKSLLCRLLIASLRRLSGTSGCFVIPAIFSFDAEYTNRQEFLPHTILAKLCAIDPLPSSIEEARATHLSSLEIDDVEKLTMDTLRAVAATTARGVGGPCPFILVVDAVDEVSLEQQQRVLSLVNSLKVLNREVDTIRLRAVVFTRYDTRIQDHCRTEDGWFPMKMPPEQVRQDIVRTVQQRLLHDQRLRRLSDGERRSLTERIAGKSDGMFRLAGLYVDHLVRMGRRKVSASYLETILEKLPSDLYAFYDEILRRIADESVRDDSFRALRWIMYAARTLWLEEIPDACALLPRVGIVFDQGISKCNPLDFVESLSGLIHIEPPLDDDESEQLVSRKHMVTIAHFSVGEYLLQNIYKSFDVGAQFFSRLEANRWLCTACFTYLAFMQSSSRTQTQGQRGEMGNFTLSAYVSTSWPYHLAAELQDSPSTSPQYRTSTTRALAHKIARDLEFRSADLYEDAEVLRLKISEHLGSLPIQLTSDDLRGTLPPQDNFSRARGENEELRHASQNPGLHAPLDIGQFRLLLLYPTDLQGMSPRCSLIVEYLENKPRFKFLSYMWGSWNEHNHVIVDGQPWAVTRTLAKALEEFASVPGTKVFWVDQICIDQSNILERNHQVQQMASVIQQASQVQVFLEPPASSQSSPHPSNLTTSVAASRAITLALPSPPPDYEESLSMWPEFDVISNRYWTRTWITQELLLARSIAIRFRNFDISWENVLASVGDLWRITRTRSQYLSNDGMSAPSLRGMQTISHVHRFRHLAPQRKPKLEELVFAFRNSEAADPRDKIYAYLGLVNHPPMPVDYTLTQYEVFTRVATETLQRMDTLELLSINPVQHDLLLPSWVPSFTTALYDYPLAPGVYYTDQVSLFHASNKQASVSVQSNPLALQLSGVIVDVIVAVCGPVGDVEANPFTGVWDIDIVRTILEDRTPAFDRFPDFVEPIFMRLSEAALVSLYALPRPKFEEAIACRMNRLRRQVAVTQRTQSLCNIPEGSADGDIIAVLDGAEVPHILRPMKDAGVYILIGECYLDGYMDGKAMEELESRIISLQEFCIV